MFKNILGIVLKASPAGFIISYWKPILLLLWTVSVALWGIKTGSDRVEAEWNESIQRQKDNAALQSADYQAYRKRAGMTNIRRELNHAITNGAGCGANAVILRLYEAAGVGDLTP